MTFKQGAGPELIAVVDSQPADIQISLYRMPGGIYRMWLGDAIGWAPERMTSHSDGMRKLLSRQSWGALELEMARKACNLAP